MPSTLSVHFLPSLTSAQELAGGLVVLVDVLRASTTIIAALAAGAAAVIPCLEVDEARQVARKLADSSAGGGVVLGGERHGAKIEGFDLGNSPSEYTPQTVGGRTVVFTTTNGTRAMRACQSASQVLIGAFVNFSAVDHLVVSELCNDHDVHLLCAGTDGRITREDVLFAGFLVWRISREIRNQFTLNDQARIACDVWNAALKSFGPPLRANERLADVLRDTQGGRNLIGIDLERDIVDAAEVDRYDIVPVLDTRNWRILPPPLTPTP